MFARIRDLVLLTTLLAPLPVYAQASDGRIGIVRLQDALVNCREGKAAKKKLEADFTGKQNQLRNKEAALKRRYQALEKRKAGGEKAETLSKDLAAFEQEWMQAQQLRMTLQKELASSEAEMTGKILKKMRPLIQRLARKNGYTVVLDASQALYYPGDLDITDKLVEAYDRETR